MKGSCAQSFSEIDSRRERVPCRHGQHERLFEDGFPRHVLKVGHRPHEGDIRVTPAQRVRLFDDRKPAQQDFHGGKTLPVGAQDGRQQRVGRVLEEADREPAGLAAMCALRLDDRTLGSAQDLPRLRQENATRLGQLHVPARPVQQRHIHLLLELADLQAQRRLGDVQALGRPREVEFLGDGDEVPEVAKVHRYIL